MRVRKLRWLSFPAILFIASQVCAEGVPSKLHKGWNHETEADQALFLDRCYKQNINESCFAVARDILQENRNEIYITNFSRAEDAYIKACWAGYNNACFNLGVEKMNGDKLRQDFTDSASYFGRSCKLGDKEGCKLKAKAIKLDDEEFANMANRETPKRNCHQEIAGVDLNGAAHYKVVCD